MANPWSQSARSIPLFNNHPRLKNKGLLLDITIVNPCVGSNLGNAARHVGKHLADAVERKKNKYRGSFPATYSLLPLAMSTCGEECFNDWGGGGYEDSVPVEVTKTTPSGYRTT